MPLTGPQAGCLCVASARVATSTMSSRLRAVSVRGATAASSRALGCCVGSDLVSGCRAPDRPVPDTSGVAMRKVIVSNLISLDGYAAGPGGDVMALPFDATFSDYNLELRR